MCLVVVDTGTFRSSEQPADALVTRPSLVILNCKELLTQGYVRTRMALYLLWSVYPNLEIYKGINVLSELFNQLPGVQLRIVLTSKQHSCLPTLYLFLFVLILELLAALELLASI